ncbi:MAG TPA: L-threonylcarbamoyladenylate synthase [Candidatus Saccharimonadales bacterium]|nr:L-threonylcarbamoyladenylate synthase [Candidatus Saccharimonadales bacterium]
MRQFTSLTDPQLVDSLNNGGVVVLPTDTVYGIVARADDQKAVERMYRLRGRAPEKPFIILVADRWQIADAELWTDEHRALASKYWPGPLSLVAPTSGKTPEYLHRGTHTLAYRIPDSPELRKLLSATGPLIAPSANPENLPTATSLAEAQAYFGDQVDGYVDGGVIADHAPSTVAGIQGGKVHIFRQGALRIL